MMNDECGMMKVTLGSKYGKIEIDSEGIHKGENMKYEFECDYLDAIDLLPVIEAFLNNGSDAHDIDFQWKVMDSILNILDILTGEEIGDDAYPSVYHETRLLMMTKIAESKRRIFEKHRSAGLKGIHCPVCNNYFNYGISGFTCPTCGFELLNIDRMKNKDE